MKRLLGALMIFGLVVGPLQAGKVTLDHAGLTLNGNLEKITGDWKAGSVVLMTHGTLAHNGMEIMAGLQEMLLERGISSLAINLSLGLNDRSGMYDCKTPHTHKNTDASGEIAVWLSWLNSQGAGSISLLGHSRGGNQTARFAAASPNSGVNHLFLVAPSVWDAEAESRAYKKRYGKELQPILEEAEKRVADGRADSMMGPVDFTYCDQTLVRADSFVNYYRKEDEKDTPSLFSSIKIPIVVFAGTDDKVVSGLIEKVEPLAKSENVRLEILDGADHYFRDLHSEDIADVIEESLKSE